jgi:ubiquinone/menaquinone biosynthesis C-methylase UbiE
VSALRADATALPFRDGFARAVVSRGSFPFWSDLTKGLSEIHRVLEPGGVAYIGRGLPQRLPIEMALKVRGKQGKSMKYDVDAMENQLRAAVASLGISDYRIVRPRRGNPEGVNYGIWLEFRK